MAVAGDVEIRPGFALYDTVNHERGAERDAKLPPAAPR
jgi:hypothetical protein